MSKFDNYIESLESMQKEAMLWQEGSYLLIAGPGSGKTRVITTRIARIINDTPDKKFKVLALTFTNAAANEMVERLENICPEYQERTFIGTFHSFCGEILRQHGVHIDIKPDFGVLSDDRDRKRILKKVMANNDINEMRRNLIDEDIDLLPIIDRLKSMLIGHEDASKVITDSDLANITREAYLAYDRELNRQNMLDFNSIIYNAYYLIKKYPAIAKTICSTYKYWSIDEFQDTNLTQYLIIKTLADDKFNNIFIVADDDQIIYQWNGASYKRLEDFIKDFSPKVSQLPTNYRCPKEIVELANNLISFNTFRHSEKTPLISAKQYTENSNEVISVTESKDEKEEIIKITKEIKKINLLKSSVAVLARNKYLLEPLKSYMIKNGIKAKIMQRRSDFITNTFQTIYSILKLTVRRQDLDILRDVVEGIKYFSEIDIVLDDIVARAKAEKIDYFNAMILELDRSFSNFNNIVEIIKLLNNLKNGNVTPEQFSDKYIDITEADVSDENIDYKEDSTAWKKLNNEIKKAVAKKPPLERFVQELDMRSKESPLQQDEVCLMTIHASKGTEFDFVFLMGLADEILPSWQSLKKDDASPEVEEERRNCFVAITRTIEKLYLSYANYYRGYNKKPSRFLREMGIF